MTRNSARALRFAIEAHDIKRLRRLAAGARTLEQRMLMMWASDVSDVIDGKVRAQVQKRAAKRRSSRGVETVSTGPYSGATSRSWPLADQQRQERLQERPARQPH